MADQKVPRSFLLAYLRAKGWREAYGLRCWTCGAGGDAVMDDPPDRPFIEHPVVWMWEHARQGHEVGVNLCHSWTKQCGPPDSPYSYQEHWFRWWWATWSPGRGLFALEIEDEDSV